MRAKFFAESVTQHSSGSNSVLLKAVLQGPNDTENAEFWKATPSGKLEMCITNPNAKNFFQPGLHYYLDFTLVGASGDSL
ncbi:MAG: hypothetical protein RMY28_037440 [Nostoc sp. ChiSLP01]|nr:hypothetical protein [Nostoc sp. CmiSLP01]MDZ8287340.1 hypothetical protein [Nostoc sp. ChiSLP01]